MAACMMVMNFLNFIFQIPLQMHQKEVTRGGHGASDAATLLRVIFPKKRAKSPEADLKSKRRKLASVENGLLLLRGHKPTRQRSPAQRLLRAPAQQRLSLTDVLLALLSEREDKRETSGHVSARRWAGREGMTARHSYIILDLLWTLH